MGQRAATMTEEEQVRAATDWEAPLTQADIDAAISHNRAEYERLLALDAEVAAGWIDYVARAERLERQY